MSPPLPLRGTPSVSRLARFRIVPIAVALAVVWVPRAIAGDGMHWLTVGVRGGIDDRLYHDDLRQVEAFASWSLPWSHRWSTGWSLTTNLEASVGALWAAGDSAWIGMAGPGVTVSPENNAVIFSLGFNPTLISRHTFGDLDLGGPIAFSTHAGVAVSVGRQLVFGYRFQHMSNANLYTPNPGVDMHMLEVSYRF